MRLGEMLALTWSGVDLGQGLVRVDPEGDKVGVGRTIVLAQLGREALAKERFRSLSRQGIASVGALKVMPSQLFPPDTASDD